MGQILVLLGRDPDGPAIDLLTPKAETDPAAIELQTKLQALVERTVAALKAIRAYDSPTELLKKAMASPKDDALQQEAFKSLLPNVEILQSFYVLSSDLQEQLPELLTYLIENDFLEHPALVKTLAELLDFVLTFDYEKMMKPALQNDFSYYRRHFGKFLWLAKKVGEGEASLISMFIAENLPMTIKLETSIKNLSKKSPEAAKSLADLIAAVANAAADTATAATAAENEENHRYGLRVMTSASVVYDRISPGGVFVSSSQVHIRKCLRVLQKAHATTASLAEQLTNSMKYSTVTYKSETTPSYVNSLLGD